MNTAELQWALIYSVIVAGKSAKFADKVMMRLLPMPCDPFGEVRQWIEWGTLADELRHAKTGNYGKLEKCLRELTVATLDLSTCSPTGLEGIHGIGPKTSRFFILWTRPDTKCAALDVHVLRWLRGLGYDAPKATPQNPSRYAVLESHFLWEADQRGVTARVLDHAIWVEGANHPERSEVTARLVKPIREAA